MRISRFCATAILCLLFLTAWQVRPGRTLAQEPTLAPPIHFDRLSHAAGWLLLDQQLYRTDDAGRSWTDISPSNAQGSTIQAVSFPDPQIGRLILSHRQAGAQPTYYLARTADGGASWTITDLVLFRPTDPRAIAGAVYLQFLDPQTGWLVIKQATGSNFSRGALFQTNDGGRSWMEMPIPIGAPVHFATPNLGWTAGGPDGEERYRTTDGGQTWQPLSANHPFPDDDHHLRLLPDRPPVTLPHSGLTATLTGIDLVTPQLGWASYVAGGCTPDGCSQESGLLSTTDGGQTWQPVALPQAISRTPPPSIDRAPVRAAAGLTERLTGHGFDKCEVATLSQLQSWRESSPYLAVNLYIGGVSRACANTALSASYLSELREQGWRFIPTWVGPQAACTSYTHRMSSDIGQAYNQGVDEAIAAVQTAAELGLTLSDQTGTVIYYDLERYDLNDVACHNAAKAFVTGWTTQMQATDNLAGLYGAGPALAAFAELDPRLDAIWPAHWISPAYDPAATVWDVYRLPNELWANRQRLRQYAGDHFETWGGTTLHLDSNVLDGPVATPDYLAPTTVLTLSGRLGNEDWYTSALRITLAAADSGGSQLQQTRYRLADAPWLVYTGSLTLTTDGVYSLSYQSKDRAGNLEAPHTATLKVDATPPGGLFVIDAGEQTSHRTLQLSLTAADNLSGLATVHLSNDRTRWTTLPYTAQITWTIPATDGIWHTIHMRFVDRAGNVSDTVSRQVCLGSTLFLPDGCATADLPPPTLHLPLISNQADLSGSAIFPSEAE